MASPAVLKLEIIADATKAIGALGKTETAAKGASSRMGTLAKAGAALGGTAALVSFGKSSVSAALDSQKAMANLEAGYKSMGETTNTAAKETAAYASELSKKIGVDDDAIIASQALLVTFGNLSSETARTAGVFDRTTVAAADMAAKGLGTMDSNAVLLGKALNDPAAGLAKLAKNGVNFTDAQGDAIKKMQESGDLIGAQKLMLQEVEKQVGGTAEATVTSQEKMNVAFGETQEAVGNALLPVLEKLAPILADMAGFVEKNADWLVPMAAGLGAVAVAMKGLQIATALLNVTLSAGTLGIIALVIAAIAGAVYVIVRNWDTIKAAAVAVFDWLKRNWPLILAILTGPFGLAVLAIVRNWDTIKNAAKAVFDWIKGAATGVWDWVAGKFDAIADAATGAFDTVTDAINVFIRGWNRLRVPSVTFDIPGGSFLPGVPDSVTVGGWSMPRIPELASGGSVIRTGFAVVHAGEQFSGVGRSFGGSTVINVSVTAGGLGADAPEIQRAVVHALRGHVGRNGPLDIPVRSAG